MKRWLAGGIALVLLAFLAVKHNKFRLACYEARLVQAQRQLFALEKQGKAYRPAHEILTETKLICNSTLASKDRKYPLGWLEGSVYLNHNNMDVVQLFHLG